jgi:hypothetical protein
MTSGSLAGTTLTISNGSYSVVLGGLGNTIATVAQDSKKQVYQQSQPKTKSNWSQSPTVKQNDFKLITTTFTCEGYLCDDDGGKTARTKAYQLEQIFRAGGNFNFTWSNAPRTSGGTNVYSVNCTSWRFQEVAGQTQAFKVTCVLAEGEQR